LFSGLFFDIYFWWSGERMNRAMFFVLLTGIIGWTGCGGGAPYTGTSIKGKVTVAGKGPLTGGTIQFVSVADSKAVAGGQIKSDGTYEIADVPLGNCKVLIDNSHLNPNKGSAAVRTPAMGGGKAPAAATAKMGAAPSGLQIPTAGSNPADSKFIAIDSSFSTAGGTPLTHNVQANGTADFEVK
jgi:hypothetical protein